MSSRYNVRAIAAGIRELVPALVQVFGLVIFLATAVAWLGFGRAEPELMGIGITTACGGWLGQAIQERLAPAPRPPEHPAAPAVESKPANGEAS
jgi:hypothetical protein